MVMVDETEFERLAKATRKRLLDIWEGDAKSADEFICLVIRYYKDNSSDVSPRARDRMLEKLAQLIQR